MKNKSKKSVTKKASTGGHKQTTAKAKVKKKVSRSKPTKANLTPAETDVSMSELTGQGMLSKLKISHGSENLEEAGPRPSDLGTIAVLGSELYLRTNRILKPNEV